MNMMKSEQNILNKVIIPWIPKLFFFIIYYAMFIFAMVMLIPDIKYMSPRSTGWIMVFFLFLVPIPLFSGSLISVICRQYIKREKRKEEDNTEEVIKDAVTLSTIAGFVLAGILGWAFFSFATLIINNL